MTAIKGFLYNEVAMRWDSIVIMQFITSCLRLGFSVLRAPKMTSPSIKCANPISLCQAFRAVIPAALTVF